MVCIVGFKTEQKDILKDKIELSYITEVIVDDPFGNYFKKYKDVKGNDVSFPLYLFNDLTNSSWGRKSVII